MLRWHETKAPIVMAAWQRRVYLSTFHAAKLLIFRVTAKKLSSYLSKGKRRPKGIISLSECYFCVE
jgi:hypothetical protein